MFRFIKVYWKCTALVHSENSVMMTTMFPASTGVWATEDSPSP